jgi:hypothetical protein
MNAERRRTHIWHAIIRSAFAPSDARTQATWLNCFAKAIDRYVDNPVFKHPSPRGEAFYGTVGCSSLDFTCEYCIQPDRAQFDFFVSSLPSPSWHSQYGIDRSVFACGASELEMYRDPPCQDEVDEVLRGLICHPRSHLHVYSDSARHEIRLGTGLHTPFLFLFQLRFQLCIDTARRQKELDRLKEVFNLTWLKRERAISPQALFGL